MNVTFAKEMRACLISNSIHDYKGNILVGIQGHLFYGDVDHNYIEPIHGISAAGTGRALALGALAESAGSKKGPRARIKSALEVAAAFGEGVEPPFTILSSSR